MIVRKTKRSNYKIYVLLMIFASFIINSISPVLLSAEDTLNKSTWLTSSAAVTVSGTSTLHDWDMKSETIMADLELPGNLLTMDDLFRLSSSNNLSLHVSIPVNSLKSGKKDMDKKAYEALKYKENPDISFTLLNLQVDNEHSTDTSITYKAEGELKIAGDVRNVVIDVLVTPDDKKNLNVTTNTKINMKDYNMKKPSAMMGMITAGEEVSVDIEWVITQG
jgi:polyisoprenoid-binding protein YceI